MVLHGRLQHGAPWELAMLHRGNVHHSFTMRTPHGLVVPLGTTWCFMLYSMALHVVLNGVPWCSHGAS